MAKLLRLRRGTDTQHTTFTGAEGEVTVNTTNDSLHVHDGTTAGGRELARADLSNLPAGTIDNADISNSAAIANSKLATSGVTAGTYGSSSAIPAITVNDRGIVTSATTSAIDSTAITNGTSNVSVAASGNITATRSGTTRLTVNTTGIDVTGVVQCDQLDVDGTIDIAGNASFFGNVDLQDNNKLLLGSGDDLEIYHDGSNSYISDNGTGNLYIKASNNLLLRSATNEDYLDCTANGGVRLYYDNSVKLATTSGGVSVAGTVTATSFSGNGASLTNTGGLKSVQVFTSSGTWTKPAGINRIKVIVTGGGGGGGNGTTNDNTGQGGGAGGTAIKVIDVSAVSSVWVTVGGGGAASTSATQNTAAANGGSGGTSSFGSYCSATGGQGGDEGWGNIEDLGRGGSGSGGNINIPGGHAASKGGGDAPDQATGSVGGASYWGGGGKGGDRGANGSRTGKTGSAYGSGGGGGGCSGGTTYAGGAGQSGVIYIEEYA